MEMIYIAAAIMMGLGGMGAAIGVGIWAASSLKVLRDSRSWLHAFRVRSSWARAWLMRSPLLVLVFLCTSSLWLQAKENLVSSPVIR